MSSCRSPASFKGGYEGAKVVTVIATIGLVFTAAYYLRAIQKVFLGKTNPACAEFPDANKREFWMIMPLMVPTILFGVYPKWLIEIYQPFVESFQSLIAQVGG